MFLGMSTEQYLKGLQQIKLAMSSGMLTQDEFVEAKKALRRKFSAIPNVQVYGNSSENTPVLSRESVSWENANKQSTPPDYSSSGSSVTSDSSQSDDDSVAQDVVYPKESSSANAKKRKHVEFADSVEYSDSVLKRPSEDTGVGTGAAETQLDRLRNEYKLLYGVAARGACSRDPIWLLKKVEISHYANRCKRDKIPDPISGSITQVKQEIWNLQHAQYLDHQMRVVTTKAKDTVKQVANKIGVTAESLVGWNRHYAAISVKSKLKPGTNLMYLVPYKDSSSQRAKAKHSSAMVLSTMPHISPAENMPANARTLGSRSDPSPPILEINPVPPIASSSQASSSQISLFKGTNGTINGASFQNMMRMVGVQNLLEVSQGFGQLQQQQQQQQQQQLQEQQLQQQQQRQQHQQQQQQRQQHQQQQLLHNLLPQPVRKPGQQRQRQRQRRKYR